MPAGEIEEMLALALVFAVHLAGGGLLVWALLDEDGRAGWRRRWWRGDDDPEPRPPGPAGDPAVHDAPAQLPLPSALASRVRLREPGRVGDAHPRPARRPAHVPRPGRVPDRP